MRGNSIRVLLLALASGWLSNAGTEDIDKVLVAGATGESGRLVVAELISQGYQVRAFVRDADRAREVLGDEVELALGDVREPESIGPAVQDMDALISAIGAGRDPDNPPEKVDYQGVKNLAEAAAAANLRQFVLISSRGVTHEDHPLNKMFNNVLIWKLEGENALRASGVPYTIVRPGGLINSPGGEGTIVFEQGDPDIGQMIIPRADIARICVAALKYPEARNKTLETHRVEGDATTDWQAMFASLDPD